MKISSKFYGNTYELECPFAEGHTLTAKEAEALNRYWFEQILNTVRGKVDKETPAEEVEKLITEVAENYEFGRRGGGGGGANPVMVRARMLAQTAAKNKPELREALEELEVNLDRKTDVAAAIQKEWPELWDQIVAVAEQQIEAESALA